MFLMMFEIGISSLVGIIFLIKGKIVIFERLKIIVFFNVNVIFG